MLVDCCWYSEGFHSLDDIGSIMVKISLNEFFECSRLLELEQVEMLWRGGMDHVRDGITRDNTQTSEIVCSEEVIIKHSKYQYRSIFS
jgi:hypothetical protein